MLQLTVHNFNDMLGRFTTAELENLLARSPYFQQAHVLLAKKYQLERNPKFDEQLQMAALYTNDRELFYAIFNQSNVVEKPKAESTYVPPVVAPIHEVSAIEAELEVIQQVQDSQNVDTNDEGALIAQDLVIEAAVVEEEPVLEAQEIESVTEIAETLTEPIAVQDNIVIEEYLEEADAETVVEAEAELPQVSFTSPHTFDEWLSVFKKGKTATKAEPKVEAKEEITEQPAPKPQIDEAQAEELDEELDKMITASVSADYLHQLVQDERHYSRGLDAFIADQIKKKRKTEKASTAPENDIAPDLVTETLAKLYESQKRYAKAIKAYEALILKFPEKNDLFAARINYLRKLI